MPPLGLPCSLWKLPRSPYGKLENPEAVRTYPSEAAKKNDLPDSK
jgi:hypothetical protein